MIKYTITFFITLLLTFSLIFQCTFISCASSHGGGGGDNHGVLTEEEKKIVKQDFYNDALDGFVKYGSYIVSQFGAIVIGHDFSGFLSNYETYKNYVMNNWKDIEVSDNGEVTIPKELLEIIKQCLDEYAKQEQTKEENGGFYLLPTTKYTDVSVTHFATGNAYRTFMNIVIEKGVLSVRTNYNSYLYFSDPFSDPDHPIALVGQARSLNNYINNPDLEVYCDFFCLNDWKTESSKIMRFPSNSEYYTSCSEAEHINTGSSGYTSTAVVNTEEGDSYNFTLYSTTGERVRVFVSRLAAQNYSLDKRKVYFSSEYYNYVPEDLTVSIDDLQKSVDDLQKIIDELLKQINNNTSEKEIEELLRLILEELRKNPGGGGSGSGSGDVTVSVDLKETNSWLSKIYAKVSEISEKISGFAGQSMDAVVDGIENLKEMLEKYLKTITSDLDDIKGQLEDMSEEEFNDKSDSFLDSATESFSDITEVAKTKFPLSIPNDLRNLLAVISPAPPEASTVALFSEDLAEYDDTGPVSYDGMISVMDDSGGDAAHLSSSGAPVFHLPIVVESVGWDYAITVDLSGFQIVATLSRTFFTLIFIVGLIQLTIKVVGLWGDLVQ